MNLLNHIKGKEVSGFKVTTNLNYNDTITFCFNNSKDHSYRLSHYGDSIPYFTNIDTYYTEDDMEIDDIEITSKEYEGDFTMLQTTYNLRIINYEGEVITNINYIVHENEHIGATFESVYNDCSCCNSDEVYDSLEELLDELEDFTISNT